MKTILIVDDSSVVRHAWRNAILQRSCFMVCGQAENGREGVDLALQLHPDLILLDLSMPVMDGLQAASEIRRLLPQLPILMVTTFCDSIVERAAIAQGASALQSKSDSFESLHQKMQELTGPG